MESSMNAKQAKTLISVMSDRPEIFTLFRFWANGQPADKRDWPDFLRAAADALSSVAPPATGDRI